MVDQVRLQYNPAIVRNLPEVLMAQLPRRLHDLVKLDLVSDPYQLNVKLFARELHGERCWDCKIEQNFSQPGEFVVPEEFIALLCACL